MITGDEIKRIARQHGVPTTTIERDYAQNWFLKDLSGLNMVLKGGTGIRKVHIREYRFSDDLDFTAMEHMDEGRLHEQIAESLMSTRNESLIPFIDEFTIKRSRTGYVVQVNFQSMLSPANRIRIKLDITRFDHEVLIGPYVRKQIFHLYSDEFEAWVRAYSYDEMLSEKVRAIFERTRPRDLFDIWFAIDRGHFREEALSPLIRKKVGLREVVIDPGSLNDRMEGFQRAWENSLRHQLGVLPPFKEVFRIINECIEAVEKTWK